MYVESFKQLANQVQCNGCSNFSILCMFDWGNFLKYPGQYFVVFIDSRVNVFIEGQGFYFAVRM